MLSAARRWKAPRWILLSLAPLNACGFFPSDPGPAGPLAIQYEQAVLIAMVPDCAPAPVEGQLRLRADDQKIWRGLNPVGNSDPRVVRIARSAWQTTDGEVPSSIDELNGVVVILVDDDYRAWEITIADQAKLLEATGDTVYTADGLVSKANFVASQCG